MQPHDPAVARAHGARRLDEVARADREHGAPDHARVVRDVDDADRDHGREQARAQDRHDPDRQEQVWKGQQDVHRAHDQAVRPAAVVGGGHAKEEAHDQRDARGDGSGLERDARAPHHPAEDVAAELVRAHEMGRARGLALDAEILMDRVVRAHLPREHRDEPEQHEEGRAKLAGGRAHEAGARRGPQGRRGAAAALDRRGDRGGAGSGHVRRTGCADRGLRTRGPPRD